MWAAASIARGDGDGRGGGGMVALCCGCALGSSAGGSRNGSCSVDSGSRDCSGGETRFYSSASPSAVTYVVPEFPED